MARSRVLHNGGAGTPLREFPLKGLGRGNALERVAGNGERGTGSVAIKGTARPSSPLTEGLSPSVIVRHPDEGVFLELLTVLGSCPRFRT